MVLLPTSLAGCIEHVPPQHDSVPIDQDPRLPEVGATDGSPAWDRGHLDSRPVDTGQSVDADPPSDRDVDLGQMRDGGGGGGTPDAQPAVDSAVLPDDGGEDTRPIADRDVEDAQAADAGLDSGAPTDATADVAAAPGPCDGMAEEARIGETSLDECAFIDFCVEVGTQRWSVEICRRGISTLVEEQRPCTRTTENQPCGESRTCQMGACHCELGPPDGCGDGCIDPAGDPNNCGECGRTCAPHETCQSGDCQGRCGNGVLEPELGEACDGDPLDDGLVCRQCQVVSAAFCAGWCDDEGTESGLAPRLIQTLPSEVTEPFALTGAAIAVHGETVLATSPFVDTAPHTGVAEIFQRAPDSRWRLSQRLAPADGSPDYRFGVSAALGDGIAVIGSSPMSPTGVPCGRVMVFRETEDGYQELQVLEPPMGLCSRDHGHQVLLVGDQILVVDPDRVTRIENRRVYVPVDVYAPDRDGLWRHRQTISLPDGLRTGLSKLTARGHGAHLLLGGVRDPSALRESGVLVAFRRDSDGEWHHAQTIAPEAPVLDGQFGDSMAVRGDWALVHSQLPFHLRPAHRVVRLYRWEDEEWQPEGNLHLDPAVDWGSVGLRLHLGDQFALVQSQDGVAERPPGVPPHRAPSFVQYFSPNLRGEWEPGPRLLVPRKNGTAPSVIAGDGRWLVLGSPTADLFWYQMGKVDIVDALAPLCQQGGACACLDGATGDGCAARGAPCGYGTEAADVCTCPAVSPTPCAEGCVDTSTDRGHCGGCGHACGAGESCVAGVCGNHCGDGLLTIRDGEMCDDGNTDPLDGCVECMRTSPAFCLGSCGARNSAMQLGHIAENQPMPAWLPEGTTLSDLKLDGDRLVVSLARHRVDHRREGRLIGGIEVFQRTSLGEWVPDLPVEVPPHLDNPQFNDPQWDAFGSSVALQGDELVVGAPLRPTVPGGELGAVFVYRRDPEGGWRVVQEISATETPLGGRVAEVVALDGEWLLLRARPVSPRGTLIDRHHMFRRGPDRAWREHARLPLPPGLATTQVHARAVLAQGHLFQTTSCSNEGGWPVACVLHYALEDDGWIWRQTLRIPSRYEELNGDLFGNRLAFDGQTLVVSAAMAVEVNTAIGFTSGFHLAGGAVGYELSADGNLSDPFYFLHHDRTSDDNFGAGVAVAGDLAYLTAGDVFSSSNDTYDLFVFRKNAPRDWHLEEHLVGAACGRTEASGLTMVAHDGALAVLAPFRDGDSAPVCLYHNGLPTCFEDGGCVCVDGEALSECDASD